MHIRTTNPIESTFAMASLRTNETTMVFELMESAAKHWRKLNGSALIRDVIRGVKFTHGIKVPEVAA